MINQKVIADPPQSQILSISEHFQCSCRKLINLGVIRILNIPKRNSSNDKEII